jgi:hypothetical protein
MPMFQPTEDLCEFDRRRFLRALADFDEMHTIRAPARVSLAHGEQHPAVERFLSQNTPLERALVNRGFRTGWHPIL